MEDVTNALCWELAVVVEPHALVPSMGGNLGLDVQQQRLSQGYGE